MAKEALDAATSDDNRKMEIIPNLQLWCGHRIPAWYVTLEDDENKELDAYNGRWIVARDATEVHEEADRIYPGKQFQLSQDPDVLDTWFSSNLTAFYPTSVLETKHDILFFCVARMVMTGLKLGDVKILGNVIDPLEVINGITLEGLHKRLEDGNVDPNELKTTKGGKVKDFPSGIPECGGSSTYLGYHQWCNKLRNAIRFTMVASVILLVLNKPIPRTVSSFDLYEFSDAATAVYYWWQFQSCVVYIDQLNHIFQVVLQNIRRPENLHKVCLDNGLRLLHPFMPFVTEELWPRLPTNDRIKSEMGLDESVVKSPRSLKERNERRLGFVLCRNNNVAEIIQSHELEISTLAGTIMQVLNENDVAPDRYAVSVVNEFLSVYLKVQGNFNAEAEYDECSGYEEKLPAHIHEGNVVKLSILMQELLSFEEACQYLERQIAADDSGQAMKEFH
ncbi:hypothetical protein M9H77_36122 [Catharanthus roseus]|uniref:Uncharacterized protein n=1 Tax=Catharanthus roseus TaxID=4058 RepID=A0ACB9ZV69_CATRO|nr:hypothetical protein M9H77_36122 [Catharanthus roseus]